MTSPRGEGARDGAPFDLTGQVALVTGAGSETGIGFASAWLLGALGARVLVTSTTSRIDERVAQLQAAGIGALGMPADLTDSSQADALVDRAVQHFGRLDVVVNNAGMTSVADPADGHADAATMGDDAWRAGISRNLDTAFFVTRAALRPMLAAGYGRVVNVASTALGGGSVDFANLQLEHAFDGWQAYANTKLMNVLFSHHLAGQLAGSGVVSNALCPGLIDTNFFHTSTIFAGGGYERLKPGMRPPGEGALMPLYLASDPAAAGINGAFYVRQGRDGRRAVPLAWDRAAAAELWAKSLAAVERWLMR